MASKPTTFNLLPDADTPLPSGQQIYGLCSNFVFVPFLLPLHLLVGLPTHAFGFWRERILITQSMAKPANLRRRLTSVIPVLLSIGKVLAFTLAGHEPGKMIAASCLYG